VPLKQQPVITEKRAGVVPAPATRKKIFVIDWRVLSAAAAVLIAVTAYVYNNVWPGPGGGVDVSALITIAKLESATGNVYLMTD